MSRKNNDDAGLLIAGLILTCTGAFTWVGIPLLIAYAVRKSKKNRGFIRNILRDVFAINIAKDIFENINQNKNSQNTYTEKTYKTTYNEPAPDAKIIYAEKVETVSSNVKEVKTAEKTAENKADTQKSSYEYTTQDILDKLAYYEEHTDLSNDEILDKISILNKMLLSMVPKLDKEELQNDIKDINKTIDKILKTLKKKKSKIKTVNNFATYYLPVTLKILIKYDEVENLRLNSDNSKEFMNTVEDKIKMIKTSFKNQLENLYADDFDDVEAELNVLETMLKSDGYTDLDEFNLRGKKQ